MLIEQLTSQNALSGKMEPNLSSGRLLVFLSVLQARNNVADYTEQPHSCFTILVIYDHLGRHSHWSKILKILVVQI